MNTFLSTEHLNVLYLVHARQDLLSGCRGLAECTRRLNQLADLHRVGLIAAQDRVEEIGPAQLAAAIGLAPELALAA